LTWGSMTAPSARKSMKLKCIFTRFSLCNLFVLVVLPRTICNK
jgi:hypothetical protein